MRSPRSRRFLSLITLLVLAGVLAGVLPACGGRESRGSVTVLASWTGTEETQFRRVLAGFTEQTGIQVNYQGTRAVDQVLLAEVRKGTPPDIAVLFSVSELAQYVRRGELRPLDDVVGAQRETTYSSQWLQMESAGLPRLYSVVIKANLKSIVWFNPAQFSSPKPQTWNELVNLSRTIANNGGAPWCMGMGSAPISGWPGTDWIEDILLHQSGVDAYQQWAAGTLPWTSPQVRQAWTTWGAIAASPGSVRGGTDSILLTDFADAGRPLFTDPPGCFLDHQASFIMGSYQGFQYSDGAAPAPDTDFDFFPFPAFGTRGADPSDQPWVVSADLAGMFNDTPQARELIRYLTTEQAQRTWPSIAGSGAFSANKQVDQNVYGDNVSRRIAGVLTSARTLCFDASDLMPAPMRNAFYRAVLEYLSDPNQLDTLLNKLDRVRRGLEREEWLNYSCGQ